MKIFYDKGVKEQEVSSLATFTQREVEHFVNLTQPITGEDKPIRTIPTEVKPVSEKYIHFPHTSAFSQALNVYDAQMSFSDIDLEVLVIESALHRAMSIIIRHEYDLSKLVGDQDTELNQSFKLIKDGKDITPPITYTIIGTNITMQYQINGALDESDKWIWEW